MCGITVCREQEHTLGEIVESTDVAETRRVGDEIEYRATSLRIGARRHDAGRFVEREPCCVRRAWNGANATTVDSDAIDVRLNGFSDLSDVIVDRNTTSGD